MRSTLAGAVAASCVALAVAATADVPPHLANARVETRSAAGGLEPAFRSAVAGARAPAWIGYAVPTEGRHQMCCWDSTDSVGLGCPGCRLEGHGGFTVSGDRDHRSDRTLSLEATGRSSSCSGPSRAASTGSDPIPRAARWTRADSPSCG